MSSRVVNVFCVKCQAETKEDIKINDLTLAHITLTEGGKSGTQTKKSNVMRPLQKK